jgi:hypothetical protein
MTRQWRRLVLRHGLTARASEDLVNGFEGDSAMRRIGISTCCALMMVLTLLAPASAQVLDFATIDIPGATTT